MPAVAQVTAAEWSHLTRDECARRWKISTRTLDSKIADGEVKAVRFGRSVRIARIEVERIDREGFSPA